MPQITIGGVTVTMPDTIRIPERAGKLSTKDQQRIPKAHKEVGKTAQATATAMRNSPERFMVPGVTPDGLADLTPGELRAIETFELAGFEVELLETPPPPVMVKKHVA